MNRPYIFNILLCVLGFSHFALSGQTIGRYYYFNGTESDHHINYGISDPLKGLLFDVNASNFGPTQHRYTRYEDHNRNLRGEYKSHYTLPAYFSDNRSYKFLAGVFGNHDSHILTTGSIDSLFPPNAIPIHWVISGLDSTANQLFQIHIGSDTDSITGTAIAESPSGSIYSSGRDFFPGNINYLLRFDSALHLAWVYKNLPSGPLLAMSDESVVVTSNNHIYRMDSSGSVMWAYHYPNFKINALAQLPNGNIQLYGLYNFNGVFKPATMGITPQGIGNQVRIFQQVSLPIYATEGIVMSDNSQAILAGQTLIKLDAAGSMLWARTYENVSKLLGEQPTKGLVLLGEDESFTFMGTCVPPYLCAVVTRTDSIGFAGCASAVTNVSDSIISVAPLPDTINPQPVNFFVTGNQYPLYSSITIEDSIVCDGFGPICNVQSIPTISLDYCVGDTATFFQNSLNACEYRWLCHGDTLGNGSTVTTVLDSIGTFDINLIVNVEDCYDDSTVTIIVNPQPTANLPNDTTLCPGQQITAMTTDGQALWSTGDTTPGLQISQPGTYAVTVTGPGGCSVSDQFSVQQVQANFYASGPFCLMDSVTFVNTSTDATSYTWLQDGMPVSNDTNFTFFFTNLDTTTFTLIASDSLCSDSISIVAQAGRYPELNMPDDTLVCFGNGVQAFVAYATFVQWNNGSTNLLAQFSQTGTYSVVATGYTGCVLQDTFHLQVQGLEPDPFFIYRLTDCPTVRFRALPQSGPSNFTHVWFFGDGTIDTTLTDTVSHTYQNNGFYTIGHQGIVPCGSAQQIFGLNLTCVPTALTPSLEPLDLFPNPNQGQFTLEIPGLELEGYELSVFDPQGRKISAEEQLQGSSLRVDLGNVVSGIYIVRITTQDSQWSRRVMVDNDR